MVAVVDGTYHKQGQKGRAKFRQDMVDLRKELVRPEQRSPSLKDRVSYLQDTIVDGRVVRGQSCYEVLSSRQLSSYSGTLGQ